MRLPLLPRTRFAQHLILLGVPLVALSVFPVGVAHAAGTGQSITVSPASVTPRVDPGGTTRGSIEVVNRGVTGYDAKIYATPYSVQGEQYTPSFTHPVNNGLDVSRWFSFTTGAVHLAGNTADSIGYTLHAPAGTPPGGYYAVAFAETQPSDDHGVVSKSRVGTVFYVTVTGPATTRGMLRSWHTPWLQQDPLTTTAEVANSGSVHFPATIHLNVQDPFGHTVYQSDSTHQVLPQTTRRIITAWPTTPLVGLFKVSGSVELLGHTTAMPISYVLVLPLVARLILGLGLLALIVWLITRLTHRTGRRGRATSRRS